MNLHRVAMYIASNATAGLAATVIWEFDISKIPLWKWLLGWVIMCLILELGIRMRDRRGA